MESLGKTIVAEEVVCFGLVVCLARVDLSERFVGPGRSRTGKVEASNFLPVDGKGDKTSRIAFEKPPWKAGDLASEDQVVTPPVAGIGVALGGELREKVEPFLGNAVEEILDIGMEPDVGELPVIEAGSFNILVAEGKSQFPYQVQRNTERRRHPGDIPGVGWNSWFHQYDFEQGFPFPGPFQDQVFIVFH